MSPLLRVLTLHDYNTRIVLLGTVLFGACAGIVGAFMLLRKKALVGDVASHAALPGIGLAYLILELVAPGTGKSPLWLLTGGAVTAAVGLLLTGLIQRLRVIKEDAALAIVLSTFFGVGVVLLTVVQSLQTGNAAGLSDFVFGKAASLTPSDVTAIAIASGLVLAICFGLFKELSLLCFDEAHAATLGWPVRGLDLLLTGLVVTVTVVGMPSVGLLLVVAQMVLPPSAARFWTNRLTRLIPISGLLGAISAALGIVASAVIPRLAAGAIIVLAGTFLFVISLLWGWERGLFWAWLAQRHARARESELDLLRACYELVERQGSHQPDKASTTPSIAPISQTVSSEQGPEGEPDLTGIPFIQEDLLKSRSWNKGRLTSVMASAQRNGLIRMDSANQYRLTQEGARRARRATRNHRLWEMYLIHFAEISPHRVDRDADEIEHVLGPETVEQLERFLSQNALTAPVPDSPH